jgi:hypothetical protein
MQNYLRLSPFSTHLVTWLLSIIFSPLGLILLPFLVHYLIQYKRTPPEQILPPGVRSNTFYTKTDLKLLHQWHTEGNLTTLEKLTGSSKFDCISQAIVQATTKENKFTITIEGPPIKDPAYYLTNKTLEFFYNSPEFWQALHKSNPNLTKLLIKSSSQETQDLIQTNLSNILLTT